ncbi:zinc finger protein 862-like [Centruroides vittatus]|uniref:zinc finger protein 862-like n=1 Tax=Centruroides vittatus TaxID=120091 RepID=UPI00350FA3EA
MALFVAESCPISHVDKLTKFCTTNFSDSKSCNNLTIGRTKCSAIISNVLAPHFKENLIVDIGDSNYSLLIDESNDISISKLLGIVIRYYSQNKKCITTSFLDLVPLKECNADAICEAIKFSLRNNALDLHKLIAIGTDNASVMIGINNGVYAKLKAEVPALILVRCLCHSLQLTISHATKEGLPRNIEFLIKETFNWFSHSAIRQSKYKELYSLMNDGNEPLKLVQSTETRWLSIQTAIDEILKQWNDLKANFNLARTNERCYTAEILFSMFDDQRNFLFLLFLKPVLDEVQRLNKIFQSENNDPTKLLQDLLNLIESCCSKIVVVPGTKITNDVVIENHLALNPYLGYQFETEINNSALLDKKRKIFVVAALPSFCLL